MEKFMSGVGDLYSCDCCENGEDMGNASSMIVYQDNRQEYLDFYFVIEENGEVIYKSSYYYDHLSCHQAGLRTYNLYLKRGYILQ